MRPDMRLNNLSQREAQRLAEEMGATVEIKRGTGELCFTHPLVPLPLLTSQSRHTASKALRAWLRRVHNTIGFLKAVMDLVPGPSDAPPAPEKEQQPDSLSKPAESTSHAA